MSLSPEQVEDFNRNGVIVARVFDPADLQPLKDEISGFVDAKARELHAAGEITDLHEGKGFAARFGHLMSQCEEINLNLDICDLLGEEMFRFIRHPKLLDAVESLLGGEITCSSIQHLRAKPPDAWISHNANFNTPWHQDSGVTQPASDAALIVTCWCPIGPASTAMGCLEVMPGVAEHLPHQASDYGTRIKPESMPNAEPMSVPCEEGEIVIMRQFTPHRSQRNVSEQCRWSMDLRYQKTGAPSGRPWLPEFVVRSRSNPSSVFDDIEDWRARWRSPAPMPEGMVGHRTE